MKAGSLIGNGSFGDIYDELDDLNNPISYFDYEYNEYDINVNMFNDNVFKEIFEQKDLKEELENMMIVRKNVDINLTCLDSDKYYVLTEDNDKIPVYKKFDNNVENFLYISTGRGYKKTWEKTNNKLDINKFIFNILNFCKSLHENNYIHKDLKLDNIFIKYDNIVVGDYGLITTDETDLGVDKTFLGMTDYMPPFCHFVERVTFTPDDVYDTYEKRMNSLFSRDLNETRVHPPIKIYDINFFEKICESYRRDQRINKYKIDLHPIGIMILQLLYGLDDLNNNDYLYNFAIKLMSNDGFYDASEAFNEFNKQNGGGINNYITILGRKRKIIKKNNKEYIIFNKELITINKAKKLENKRFLNKSY